MAVGEPVARVPASQERVDLEIGGMGFEIDVPAGMAASLRQRYAGFERLPGERGPMPVLRLSSLREGGESVDFVQVPAHVHVVEDDDRRLRFWGGCAGSIDLSAGCGTLESTAGLGGVDALLRLSLSMLAPTLGWVVLHGAAIEAAGGGWILLLGRSGAGKSTAAAAFASTCDDLVLARSSGAVVEVASTPWWNGRPGRAECRGFVCLERSEAPEAMRLRGPQAFRAVLSHVVRHAPHEATDRATFARLGAMIERAPTLRVRAATGGDYLPWLEAALESLGVAPRA